MNSICILPACKKKKKKLFLILDDGSTLFTQMVSSYSTAIAPGTAANRKKQAEEYLRFTILYNVPHLSPTVTHVCMYAQRLANKHVAPNSIKNYLSGAKTWVAEHQGSTAAFFAPQLALLVKGFVKKSTHEPSSSPHSSTCTDDLCISRRC